MNKTRSLNILAAATVLLLSCGLYLKIMTPVISPGDGPEFAVTAYTLGISHPPGYPFWMLAGKVFTTLPLGNIGWRVNLVSLTSIVLAAGLLFIGVVKLTSLKSALVTALTFMATFQVMRAASGAEVYPQLILLTALLFALSVNRAFSSRSYLAICLLTGIGVSVHYLSLLFIPGWLILKIKSWTALKRLSFKKVVLALLAFVMGLTLFCALPVRSVKNPFLNWGQVEFAEYFSAHVKRSAYRQMEREGKTDWLSRKKFFFDFIRRLFLDTYAFGVSLLFLWGLLVLFLKDKRLFFSIATLFFLPVIIIIFHLRFQFNPLNQSRLNNYYLPVYLIGAVAIGFGYRFWEEKLKRNGRLPLFLLFLFSLVCFIAFNYQKVDQRKSYFILDLGENTIKQLPQETIFFSKSDPVAFPLWFVQAVNNQRRDVAHIVTNFMQPSQFAWYRYHLRAYYPRLLRNPGEENLRDKINGINPWVNQIIAKYLNKSPLYYELNQNLLISKRYLRLDGTVYKIVPLKAGPPDLKRTALVLDKLLRQRGIAGFSQEVAPKIKETAFVYAVTYYFTAERLRKNGRFSSALYYLERALAIYPRISYFRRSLGQIYEATGKDTLAIGVYRDLLAENPDYREANLGLNRILTAQGKDEEARKYLKRFQRTMRKQRSRSR